MNFITINKMLKMIAETLHSIWILLFVISAFAVLKIGLIDICGAKIL